MPINYDDETTTTTKEPPKARKVVRSGWDAVDAMRQEDSNYAVRLKTGADPVVIKFLENEPYAVWRQHWVNRPGQKSFVCPTSVPHLTSSDDCPLCDAGDRPRPLFAFNIVLLERGEAPALRSYETGSRVIATLKNFNEDERQGPLSKHYWAVSRSGSGPQTQYNHLLIKERDLSDEWSLSALSADELEGFTTKAYTEDILRVSSHEDLVLLIGEASV
jgi:hypothetical protein